VPQDFLSELATELQASQKTRDLAESLTQVMKELNKHWTTTHLTWFTDHGVGHAWRVARCALELGTIPKLSADLQLTGLERYILCAASLLHDIGMNDLSPSPRPLGAMLPEDYDRIRHGHSGRSGEMIIEDPVRWGLPSGDWRLAELVSLVARAHGTKYYRTTIPDLKPRDRVRNEPIRGPLLAALLLMADELDLCYDRTAEIPGNIPLNAISEAHTFKHQCISSASTKTADDGAISITLQLSIPEELAEQTRANLERWVVGKLRRQMALTAPEIAGAFGSRLHFNRAVAVDYVRRLKPGPLPSGAALAVIDADVAREDLIDHKEKLRRAVTALNDGHVLITGKWTAETRHDPHGREDLYLATIESVRAAPGSVVACSRRLHDMGAGEASDVLEEWAHGLTREYDIVEVDGEDEQSKRIRLVAACVAAVEALDGEKTLLLGVSCFDKLTEEGMRWLADTAIEQISDAGSCALRLVMTADRESLVPMLVPQVSHIRADDIDGDEVVEFLSGIGLADARVLATTPELDYFHLKQISHRKIIDLQDDGSR